MTDPDAPGWARPPVTGDQLRNDALLAAALFAGSLLSLTLYQVSGLYERPAPGWASVLCLALTTLPLAVRRRWPSAVLVVVAAAFVVVGTAEVPEVLVVNIALFVALYTVGAWDPDRRRATLVRALVVVGMFVWLVSALFRATSDPDAFPDLERGGGALSPLVAFLLVQLLTNVVYFGGAWWFGDHGWAAARQHARTALRTEELERSRRQVAEQAVALERLRLARELHDAVAHHVSLMGVQATVARTLLGSDPTGASDALEHVEHAARVAIEELQAILGTLRDADTTDEAVGSLGVDRLPELADDARRAGLPVTFQVVGSPVPLSPLVSLNLYRIAQEALTNARKHAGPRAHADVRLRYLSGSVELEVSDDGVGARGRVAGAGAGAGAGRGPATDAVVGGGRGLLGMRERASADGGVLQAGPGPRGGFLVRVTVPLVKESVSA